jgi:hypothetical protein
MNIDDNYMIKIPANSMSACGLQRNQGNAAICQYTWQPTNVMMFADQL